MAVIARKRSVTDGQTDGQTQINIPRFFLRKKWGIKRGWGFIALLFQVGRLSVTCRYGMYSVSMYAPVLGSVQETVVRLKQYYWSSVCP